MQIITLVHPNLQKKNAQRLKIKLKFWNYEKNDFKNLGWKYISDNHSIVFGVLTRDMINGILSPFFLLKKIKCVVTLT